MPPSKPNILILVLDTARATNISCYGHERKTTPNLDSIAAEGIRYKNAITNAPWTLPSHASIFTGQLPFEHGAHAKNKYLDESCITLAERLRQNDYETTLISNNGWLTERFGVCRGFVNCYQVWKLFQTDTDIVKPYREYIKSTNIKRNPYKLLQFVTTVMRDAHPIRDALNLAYGFVHSDEYHHSGDRITEILYKRVHKDDPFFIVANYLEPHLKYLPPEPYRSRFLPNVVSSDEIMQITQDVYDVQFGNEDLSKFECDILERLYDGEIAYADSFVGRVYEILESAELLDDTYLIIVGDHGENIGDHGLLGHNSSLHETVMRVPLVIRPPEQQTRVVERTVQLSDIYQTVLSAANIENRDFDEGDRFSYDVLRDDLMERPNLAISQYAGLQLDKDRIQEEYPEVDIELIDSPRQCITEDGYKLIERANGSDELYDLEADPREKYNYRSDKPELSRALAKRLHKIAGDVSTISPVQESEIIIKNRLKDLGYY